MEKKDAIVLDSSSAVNEQEKLDFSTPKRISIIEIISSIAKEDPIGPRNLEYNDNDIAQCVLEMMDDRPLRSSLVNAVFDDFMQKWGNVQPQPESGTPRATAALNLHTKPKEELLEQGLSAQTCKSPSMTKRRKLDRSKLSNSRCRQPSKIPRNKDEASKEITLFIDAKLNEKLLFTNANEFPVNLSQLAGDNIAYCKRKRPDDTNDSAEPFLFISFECQSVAKALEDDPAAFLSQKTDPYRASFAKIYVVLLGFKAHGAKLGHQINKQFKDAVISGKRLSSTTRSGMTQSTVLWQKVENRAWLAALQLGLKLVLLETYEQYRDFLMQATKCVAFEPYSHRSGESLNFCAQSIHRRVGQNLPDTYQLILSEMPRVTMPVASAISSRYPTLRSLWDAYEHARTPDEGKRLLERVEVRGKSLGLALSSRIHQLLTCRDPDALTK